MDAAGVLLSEPRGARTRKSKPRMQVLLKLVTWYWPKSLFYHLVFKPAVLPFLRTKCAYVTLSNNAASMTEMAIAALPPKPPGTVRLVCVSDTHDRFQDVGLPPGDVLVHAGDILFKGGRGRADYESFNRHLGTLPHPVKLVIAGNHDWWVDSQDCSKAGFASLLSHGTYLEHDHITLPDTGLSVYGSPRTPLGTSENVAFQYLPQDEPKAWDDIPHGVDVLITHATPAGHGPEGLGDPQLTRAIKTKRPRVVVCGHDHTAYGASVMSTGEGGMATTTLVLNPSIMNDVYYFPVKVPLVYDLPMNHTTATS